MIKIFVHKDHHELEDQINKWLSTDNITIIFISHSICSLDDDIIHSIIINYTTKVSNPC